ncbi:glycerol-3-phosphate 1-O-acyltransferase PlsY [bacterium]|nr:glycerol-3-phosphate 1-O-acyltransferase PlsY [bacterium]
MILGIAAVIGAYLVGSIPFGLIVGKIMAGSDVRQKGSGNIGATNVMRAAGKTAGIITLLLDIVKGYIAVLGAQTLAPQPNSLIPLYASIAVLLGHCFPIYLRFRGGKGVATALGIFLRLAPVLVLIALGIFIVVVAITRFVSVGSIIAVLSVPIIIGLAGGKVSSIALSSAIAALVIAKHNKNIARLIRGEENKLDGSK